MTGGGGFVGKRVSRDHVLGILILTLWRDADPDVPVYKEAKAEYAALDKTHAN